MGELRWVGVVGAVLVLAGCSGGSGTWSAGGSTPVSSTPTPVVTPTPRPTPKPTPTPTPKPTVKPKPVVPEADCTGSFKDGRFDFSGSNIFISDQGFTCNGGQMVGYEVHKTAITFYVGNKHVTLGPKKSAAIGGYRIRVGIANSKQATFTIDRITST
ncbi:hypothetical protein EV137_1628 [Kribbella pratensis]|uniref:Uncharacterized protein n=1 Tax=Kribbella pratensis TaxID=2512112 RepID=A0ABY2FMG9_9ACTN|nr:hypothetical protein [Kribbella pratensis]TDW94326.1 hypothetical protein EV137_1628 [Kribbella pratensis]